MALIPLRIAAWLTFLAIFTGLDAFTGAPLRAAETELPVVYSGRIAGDANSTRLILDFDREISVRTFYMEHPDRIVIDLAESIFNLGGTKAVSPRGLISFIRFGTIANGRSRIVLSLAGPAEITGNQVSQRSDNKGYRLILDLGATDADNYAILLNAQTDLAEILGDDTPVKIDQEPRKKNDGRFIIVIDPGHGGIDGGAVGASGVLEKDLTLSFANKLAEKLRRAGPFDVEMTRDRDEFVSLKQRVALGQQIDADLFISIHADTLDQLEVRGSTVYTLSKKASDRLSEQLARSENSVDLVAGLSLPAESEIVTDILVDFTTRETKKFSRQFSNILVKNLENRITLIKNPQRSAAFGVLKAPKVPGVLFELGYLSNAEDEKLLGSQPWQEKVTTALTQSVVAFFKPRL